MTNHTQADLEDLLEKIADYCASNDLQCKSFLSHTLKFFAARTDADPEGVNVEGKIGSDINWLLNKPKF